MQIVRSKIGSNYYWEMWWKVQECPTLSSAWIFHTQSHVDTIERDPGDCYNVGAEVSCMIVDGVMHMRNCLGCGTDQFLSEVMMTNKYSHLWTMICDIAGCIMHQWGGNGACGLLPQCQGVCLQCSKATETKIRVLAAQQPTAWHCFQNLRCGIALQTCIAAQLCGPFKVDNLRFKLNWTAIQSVVTCGP